MSKSASSDIAMQLQWFAATYNTVTQKGEESYAGLSGGLEPSGPIKRIGPIYAFALGPDVNALGIMERGEINPIAKVNGKGRVEPMGDIKESLLADILKRGVVPAKPSAPEKSNLTHYYSNHPAAKIL